ncbi:isopentenyl-diphosphate Delta-isomerase [Candidatus Woesearchaeota archaeon]|nr:isopentenyl-diphosphate Delta-isomerase [Candidatus Woesearchaeota archaeon]
MQVILVDKNDKEIGISEKLSVHKSGKLHRAFSIFVFNSKKELMLQKRSLKKYHSPDLWTNTCCSHPQPGKELIQEAEKRLEEEMGFSCRLEEKFSFIYKAELGELTEHEYDHVLFGRYDSEPNPNPEEVSDWRWVSMDELKKEISEIPDKFTEWLKLCIDRVIEEIKSCD